MGNCDPPDLHFTDDQLVDLITKEPTERQFLRNSKANNAVMRTINNHQIILKTYSNGIYKGKYKITAQNSKEEAQDNHGEFFFYSGWRYQGQFSCDKFHGKGTLTNQDGSFSVTWENGKFQQASGTIGKNNSKVQIENLKQQGKDLFHARLKFQDSSQYEGSLLTSSRMESLIFTGKGKMAFPDGSTYSGDFDQGQMEGNGQYTWKDGSYYKGRYKNGLKNGEGVLFWKEKNIIYKGEWQDGKPYEQKINLSLIKLSNRTCRLEQ